MRFIHTADWQLGKPFAGVEDVQKRALLQNERLHVVRRIGEAVREHGASFVVVAGDLFDSPSATKSTVAAACSAIGSLGVPVFAIPGNHDHGGPGSLWEQDFFLRERASLAPNLVVLLQPEPAMAPGAVLFPCPLLRRHESSDPTAWLRSGASPGLSNDSLPHIVLAHGTVLDFGAMGDEEEAETGVPNLIDLARLPRQGFDYIALGDWHGTRQVAENAWYSGTPELDRFVKGSDHQPGHILLVDAERGAAPQVKMLRTGAIGWHDVVWTFADDSGPDQLQGVLEERFGTRAGRDLLRLELSGSLGLDAAARLESQLDSWKARLLRLKLDDRTVVAPNPAELDELVRRSGDPLIARVAARLVSEAAAADETAAVARIALRELHAACVRWGGRAV
jgi:DNA repair exonuclease SbcCD nuclease subunit